MIMEDILATAANYGSIGTGLVLLYLLIERLFVKGYLRFGKKPRPEDIPKWATELMQYFNHETTETLKDIADGQQQMCRKMDTMISKQEEMLKYGVPKREK